MLKVVGASWQKTRIGTYILIGAGLLVIGAFFIAAMERPHYDGTYCATALWSEKIGFQIRPWKQQNDLVNIPKGAARVCYKDSIYENGWAQLEIETQRAYPDWVQAYAAGMLEGQLTWSNIYNQWSNTMSSSCDRDENSQKFCEWLRSLLSRNYYALKLKALEHGKHDHYWHQISLYFSQLEGLETGYTRGATRARSDLEEDIPFTDFLLMNAAADIEDLKIYFENFVLNGTENNGAGSDGDSPRSFLLPSATMLTRIFQTEANPNVWQLLFGHSSAGSYSSMLRIQKRYKFRYHFTPNQRTNTVPGMDITFTGYPGILGSTDDFYIIKGRQVQSIVAGVPLMNADLKLWSRVNLRDMIPLTARVMAANRMSQNRRSWAKAMAHHPVTGAKQWITIDLGKLNCRNESGSSKHSENSTETETTHIVGQRQSETSDQCRKSLVWIGEQLPGKMRIDDVTSNFLFAGNSTWIANGIPYFDDILELSAIAKENFSAELDDAKALTTLHDVDTYLRTHGFRGDLLGEQSVAYGNIDIKLFSHNQPIGVSDYHAFAGPIYLRLDQYLPKPAALESMNSTAAAAADPVQNDDTRPQRMIIDGDNLAEIEMITERRPVRNDIRAIAMRRRANGNPFKWSNADILGVQHVGHPDEWNFDQIKPKWAW